MIRTLTILTLLLAASPLATATVTEWSGRTAGTDYVITSTNVEILASGIFKFQSVTGGSLDAIGLITIADSVTGTVTIHIARNPADSAGTNGATDVGAIDLTNEHATPVAGNLAELRITGDLATAGPIVVANVTGVVAVTDDVQNSFTINTDLDGDIDADTMGDITIGRDINSAGDTLTPNTVGNITIGRHQNGTINVGTCGNIEIAENFEGSITASSLGNVSLLSESTTITNGALTVNGNYAGAIYSKRPIGGDWLITLDLSGTILIGRVEEPFLSRNLTGSIVIGDDLTSSGRIQITGNLAASGSNPARISIAGDVDSTTNPPIRVWGSITGSGAALPNINVGGQLGGTIAIDGSLANANGSGAEIVVNSLGSLGAIAINSNGASSSDDDWADSATVLVVATDEYDDDATIGNNPTDRVWHVSPCVGDLNGDRSINSDDNATVEPGSTGCSPATLFCVARVSESQYRTLFPGLEGSRGWHGDCNFSGGFGTDDGGAFSNLIGFTSCCVTEVQEPCPGDVGEVVSGNCRFDYDVDLTDLTTLLSGFGVSDASHCQGDLTGDGIVGLNDLTQLLSHYGEFCCPLSCCTAPSTASVTINIAGFDTLEYSGGGFSGEKTHFVFDALVTISDGGDDWVGSGVTAARANGATFRLVPSPGNPPVPGSSVPDKYATFFSVPYAVNTSNRFTTPFPSGGLVGGYSPASSSYTYSTTNISAAWYDLNASSNDGPAAVFRLVIDVSGVSGANTGGGFGSVYFTTGSPGSGDIKVADMTFDVAHKYADSGSTVSTGSFYVTD